MTQTTETETRLLAGCLVEPEVLAIVTELEIDDFTANEYRVTFTEIRNLQARNAAVSIEAVVERFKERDRMRDTTVAEKVSAHFLTALVAGQERYGDDLTQAVLDQGELRIARDDREQRIAERAMGAMPAPPKPKISAASTGVFLSMATRVAGERDQRLAMAPHALNYHNAYLDDCLRAILPHDLVLLGAPTGLGKTDMAIAIAMANASKERAVAYFALEAEPLELERRVKFKRISTEVHRRQLPRRDELNYVDWLLGHCEDIVGDLNDVVDRWFSELAILWTFYRGAKFTQKDLCGWIQKIHRTVEFIVVDHLHYVDAEEDENENRAMHDTIKAIRDVSLRVGKPVLVVAHLRKQDTRARRLVPLLDDFLGTKQITNICTQAITIERANVDAPKWWLSPTFVSILKDRRGGAPPFVALEMFDRRTGTYEERYTLGRLIKGGTEWEPLKVGEQPNWARAHRQLELELPA